MANWVKIATLQHDGKELNYYMTGAWSIKCEMADVRLGIYRSKLEVYNLLNDYLNRGDLAKIMLDCGILNDIDDDEFNQYCSAPNVEA